MEEGGEEEQREDLCSPAVTEERRGGEREPAGTPAQRGLPASHPPALACPTLLPLPAFFEGNRRKQVLESVCLSPSPPGHATGNAWYSAWLHGPAVHPAPPPGCGRGWSASRLLVSGDQCHIRHPAPSCPWTNQRPEDGDEGPLLPRPCPPTHHHRSHGSHSNSCTVHTGSDVCPSSSVMLD